MDIMSYILGKKGGTELPSFPESSIDDDGKTLFIRRNWTNFKNELVWEKPYPGYQTTAARTKVLTVKHDQTTGRNVLDWESPQDGHPREVYHAYSRDKTSDIQRHVIYPADDDSWNHLPTEASLGNFCIIQEHPSNRVWFVIEKVRVQVGSQKENGVFCVTFTQNGGVLGRTYLEDTQQTYGEEEEEGQPWPVGTLYGTETVLIPEHTVSDAGKYLKVDANGSLEWGT